MADARRRHAAYRASSSGPIGRWYTEYITVDKLRSVRLSAKSARQVTPFWRHSKGPERLHGTR